MEGYSDNNPKTAFGALKTPINLVPPSAIEAEAEAFRLGAKKYGPYNWRQKRISSSVYYAAAMRHLFAWWQGEDTDPESGAPHLGHARACLALVIDAKKYGMLNDDRPGCGQLPPDVVPAVQPPPTLSPAGAAVAGCPIEGFPTGSQEQGYIVTETGLYFMAEGGGLTKDISKAWLYTKATYDVLAAQFPECGNRWEPLPKSSMFAPVVADRHYGDR